MHKFDIEHEFKNIFNREKFDIDKLINNPSKMNLDLYLENLNNLVNFHSPNEKNEPYDEGECGQFVQFGFEALIEVIIKFFPNDIRIKEYVPQTDMEYVQRRINGIAQKGAKIVNISYDKKEEYLTAHHIAKFFAQAKFVDGFDKKKDDLMFHIFTNTNGIHPKTQEYFLDQIGMHRIRVYNKDYLNSLMNGNEDFWKNFKTSFNKNQNVQFCLPKYSNIKLESEQRAFINKIHSKKTKRGIFFAPPGFGKGVMMLTYTEEVLQKALQDEIQSPKALLVFPTLSLLIQFINRVREQLSLPNILIINVSSSQYNCGSLSGVSTTLRSNEILKIIKNHNGPVIMLTTYHSVNKSIETFLKNKMMFEVINCDEAHNLVSGHAPEDHREILIRNDTLQVTKSQMFWTATQKLSNGVNSMDNPELYGPIIAQKFPAEAIKDGSIVPPILYELVVEEATINNHLNLDTAKPKEILENPELNGFIVSDYYEKIEKVNQKFSSNYKYNEIQLLVKCSGIPILKSVLESKNLQEWQKKNPDVIIVSIASEKNSITWNGKKISKNKFIGKLSQLQPTQKAIVFYVDMIGEGVDVPTFNTFLELGVSTEDKTKAVQSTTRTVRTHKEDRDALKSGKINLKNRERNWLKPYAYICKVKYNVKEDMGINDSILETTVRHLYEEGYQPSDYKTVTDGYNGDTVCVPLEGKIQKIFTAIDIETKFNRVDLGLNITLEEKEKQEEMAKKLKQEREDRIEQQKNSHLKKWNNF